MMSISPDSSAAMRALNSGMNRNVRGALPVVGITLEHEPLVAAPLDESEGPGADRLLGQLLRTELLQGLGGHDEQVRQRRVIDQARERLLRDQPDRRVVDDLHLLDRLPVRGRVVVALVRGVEQVVERGLHRLRGERFAVVELHTRAQRELPGGVVDHLPARGQHRLRLQRLRVAVEQPVVDVFEHVVGRPVHDGDGQQRARLGAEPDDDLLRAGPVLGQGRCRDDRAEQRDDH
jgi:hypothetical protein